MPMIVLKPRDSDTNGANVAQKVDTTGTNFDYQELRYDATTQERADFGFQMDEFYDSQTIYVDIWWKAAAITNNVVWQVNLLGRGDNAQFDSALGSDNYIQDAPVGTTEYLSKATVTISSTGITPSQWVILRISRDADSTNATDNMTGDAKLIGAIMRFNVAG